MEFQIVKTTSDLTGNRETRVSRTITTIFGKTKMRYFGDEYGPYTFKNVKDAKKWIKNNFQKVEKIIKYER